MDAKGTKHDQEKIRLDLIPPQLIWGVGRGLTHGATKYGDRNWEDGIEWNRVYGALQRHLNAWWMGEDKDLESGESHLAHAACCIAFLLTYAETHPEFDNRPKLSMYQRNSP